MILSQYADESYAFELFRNGTAGPACLLKDRVGDLRQLLAALREMAQGPGSAGIAAELSLSESLVEKYVNAIFAKLDLASEQRGAAMLTFLRDVGLRSAG